MFGKNPRQIPPPASKLKKPSTTINRTDQSKMKSTESGTKMTATSKISQTTLTANRASGSRIRQPDTTSTKIRMLGIPNIGGPNIQQTTRVLVAGAGIKPVTSKVPVKSATCSKKCVGASSNVRSKLPALAAKTEASKSQRLKETVGSSVPENVWSVNTRETMTLKEGQYGTDNKEVYGIQHATIQRNIETHLPPTSTIEYIGQGQRGFPTLENVQQFPTQVSPRNYQQLPAIVSSRPQPQQQQQQYTPTTGICGGSRQREASPQIMQQTTVPGRSPPVSPQRIQQQQQQFSPTTGICGGSRQREASPQRVQQTTVPGRSSPVSPQRMQQQQQQQFSPTTTGIYGGSRQREASPQRVQQQQQQQYPEHREMIFYPETEHTINEQIVRPIKMNSPVGEIPTKQVFQVERQLLSSPQGTILQTHMTGTRTINKTEAAQIEMVKRDKIPAPRSTGNSVSFAMQSSESASRTKKRTKFPPVWGSKLWELRQSKLSKQIAPSNVSQPSKPQQLPTNVEPTSPIRPSPCQQKTRQAESCAKEFLNTSNIPSPSYAKQASPDLIKNLIEEERRDVIQSQTLNTELATKLDRLKQRNLLEETLQEIPAMVGDDGKESIRMTEDADKSLTKSDVIASLMYSEERGIINTGSSPKQTYDALFGAGTALEVPLEDEKSITISRAAPAPLHDIVVPVGEASHDEVSMVVQELQQRVSDSIKDIPIADAYSESVANQQSPQTTPINKREYLNKDSSSSTHTKQDDNIQYIPSLRRGELLEEEMAPWQIDLSSLEELVGARMSILSTASDRFPSDESIRATLKRFEYILDVERPKHYSCVQLRGTQSPSWFPGYYYVHPEGNVANVSAGAVVDSFVRLENDPSKVYKEIWNIFKPNNILDHSEIVML